MLKEMSRDEMMEVNGGALPKIPKTFRVLNIIRNVLTIKGLEPHCDICDKPKSHHKRSNHTIDGKITDFYGMC